VTGVTSEAPPASRTPPPCVTIVMPTYNRAALLPGTIDAVLAQTFGDFELIVVDDGSGDDTAGVLGRRYADEPRLRYLRKPNGGVSSARNLGLAQARGEFIAFLDSDDLWQPWKLQLQVAALRALAPHGVGMLWTNLDVVDEHGQLVKQAHLRDAYSAYGQLAKHGIAVFEHEAGLAELVPEAAAPQADARVYWGDVRSRMLIGNLCQPSTLMMTRERADAIGGFDESMVSGEDHAYHLKASRAGPAALLDASAVLYRKGAADQLTQPAYRWMIASNYLKTLLPEVERERAWGRLDLPQALLTETIASACEWVGMEMWYREDYAAAHRHFGASLRQRWKQPKLWALYLVTAVPPAAIEFLRQTLRRLRPSTH
jgi:glycosyltransferase involved in cell wall biosynthesis